MKPKKIPFLLTVCLYAFTVVHAQDNAYSVYFNNISKDELKRHVMVLASDSLEGRETATEGMRKAAGYTAEEFRKAGLMPAHRGSYFQELPFIRQNSASVQIQSGSTKFEFAKDYFCTEPPASLFFTADQLVFAGYGITDSVSGWNDYSGVNAEGKALLILDGEPVGKKGNSLITGDTARSIWSQDNKIKYDLARSKNPIVIFFVDDDFQSYQRPIKRWLEGGRLRLYTPQIDTIIPVIQITRKMADQLMKKSGFTVDELRGKISHSSKPQSQELKSDINLSVTSEQTPCTNIMGYVEGRDLKNEIVVLTAHIDHLGKRDGKIYYGADDNASGCASVLNIATTAAKAAKEGKGPRRTMLFILFSGEEKGLLGSNFYVNNPVFPLEQTIANLNADMIGRSDTMARNTTNYTYVIGSDKMSSELHDVLESTNAECCEVKLDFKYNDPNDPLRLYYRSDHYSFVKKGIPAIFYFTGLHADYHQPSDTPDKVDYNKLESISRLIFSTAWELANRDKRIVVDIE